MVRLLLLGLWSCISVFACVAKAHAQPTQDEVVSAMHRAVTFFREHASAGGGYIFQLSEDLSKREGEGRVGKSTAWIEPPATPSVGMAYLESYRACGDRLLLEAAKETANALVRGQLRSGGWDNLIEFAPKDRLNYSYRVDPDSGKKSRNFTTFDDDKSQSAMRFLMQLDQELGFNDPIIHECALYALDATLKAQFGNGAWPQRYSEFPDPAQSQPRKASIPERWSRTFTGEKYTNFYTLNDDTLSDLITTMLEAWQVYQDPRYLASALRGGDFLLMAQLPEPQPAWAQQYDQDMHPAWARKFEPPAISRGESQGVIRTLMTLYRLTATIADHSERFLEPIPAAIAYLRRSALDQDHLARFYELQTNRPLFFTKKYELVYTSNDLPTHYGFIVDSKLDSIENEFKKLRQTPQDKLWPANSARPVKRSASFDKEVQKVIDALDDRGAWVESGELSYHEQEDKTQKVIRSKTFNKNVRTLAMWLGADAK